VLLTEIRVVRPAALSRTNTSARWLVSPNTKLVAIEVNATRPPRTVSAAPKLPQFPGCSLSLTDTRWVCPVERLHRNTLYGLPVSDPSGSQPTPTLIGLVKVTNRPCADIAARLLSLAIWRVVPADRFLTMRWSLKLSSHVNAMNRPCAEIASALAYHARSASALFTDTRRIFQVDRFRTYTSGREFVSPIPGPRFDAFDVNATKFPSAEITAS
jgi:hypothetical protein